MAGCLGVGRVQAGHIRGSFARCIIRDVSHVLSLYEGGRRAGQHRKAGQKDFNRTPEASFRPEDGKWSGNSGKAP